MVVGIIKDGVCTASVTEKRSKEVKSEPGFGPIKSLVFLQLAGDTGLVNPGLGTWGHTEKEKNWHLQFLQHVRARTTPKYQLE